ncbi:hypothetical protein GGX14DRAFT_404499 [Mycena pura]|uniref:Uncharacterized protein n=1 Tax=Mycena pura TaxID=153505 RepID=A0AAD6Y3G5_9AGAR|nr:hypothetical protein GGX14DRAFT_404499 [Mycena pura]
MTNCPGHHARCGDGIGTQSCATAVKSASLSALTNCPRHHARCLPLPCDTFPLQLRFRALFHRAADVTGALDWPRVPRNRSGATLRAHWRHLVHPAGIAFRSICFWSPILPRLRKISSCDVSSNRWRQTACSGAGKLAEMKHGTLRLKTPKSRQNIVGAIADCAALRAGVRSFEEQAAYVLYSMATSRGVSCVPAHARSQLAAHERMPASWRQTACSGAGKRLAEMDETWHGPLRNPRSRQKIVGAIADCSALRTGVRSFEERAAYVPYGDGAPSQLAATKIAPCQLAAHAHQNSRSVDRRSTSERVWGQDIAVNGSQLPVAGQAPLTADRKLCRLKMPGRDASSQRMPTKNSGAGKLAEMKHGTLRLKTPKSRQKIVGAIADCSALRTAACLKGREGGRGPPNFKEEREWLEE